MPDWCFQESPGTGAIHERGTTIGLDLAKHVFQVHGVDSRSLFDAVAVMTGLTPLVSELEARLAADVEFKGVDA